MRGGLFLTRDTGSHNHRVCRPGISLGSRAQCCHRGTYAGHG